MFLGLVKERTLVILPISHKRRLRVGDAVLIWPELVMRFMGWLRPSDKVDWRGKTGLVPGGRGKTGLVLAEWIGSNKVDWRGKTALDFD